MFRLRNAADGVLPRIPKDVGDTKVGLKEINRAVKALQSTEMNYLKKNEKAKIRNRKNKGLLFINFLSRCLSGPLLCVQWHIMSAKKNEKAKIKNKKLKVCYSSTSSLPV